MGKGINFAENKTKKKDEKKERNRLPLIPNYVVGALLEQLCWLIRAGRYGTLTPGDHQGHVCICGRSLS